MSKEALHWWNRLRNTRLQNTIVSETKDKGYYTDKYFGYGARMFKYLKTEEIEKIYKSEHSNGN